MRHNYNKKIVRANRKGKCINVLYPKKVINNQPIRPVAKTGIPIVYLEEKAETYVDEISDSEEFYSLLDEINEVCDVAYTDEEEMDNLLREIDIVRQL